MLTHADIKLIQSLSNKKARMEHQLFVVEGVKMIEELLSSDWEAVHIYGVNAVVSALPLLQSNPYFEVISEKELQRISHLTTPNQVLAVVRCKSALGQYHEGVHIALDGIQNPGNLGTIIRIADWFGVRSIIASEDSADLYNPKVVQSTMGSIFRIPLLYADLSSVLKSSPLPKYGALLKGQDLQAFSKVKDGIFIIGNESVGIRPPLTNLIDHRITIPRHGHAESLNAAVASGIILSHLI